MLETALLYLAKGWSVLPLQGKIPRIMWQEYKARKPTEDEVRKWWTQWPDAGIGIALGSVSGVVRVDVEGSGAVPELERLGGLPETLEFTTPAGGRGWLLKYVDGTKTEVLWKGEGGHHELRLQSDGAYTVLPPSPHPAGGRYAWTEASLSGSAILANPPQWLYDRTVARIVEDLAKELRPTLKQPDRNDVQDALAHIEPDDYDTWVKVGMALKSADMYDEWEAWSRKSDKFQDGECTRKWASFNGSAGGLTLRSVLYWAEQNGYKAPYRHEPITDLGNANMLCRMYGEVVKHSTALGWLAWDGKRWKREDAEKAVQEYQKAVIAFRVSEATKSYAKLITNRPPDWEKEAKRKRATLAALRRCEDEQRFRGSRLLAASDPLISADHRSFDTHPMLLNCVNGTLSFINDELREHVSSQQLTQLCPTPYVVGAESALWLQFLEGAVPDPDVRDFLQQFFGVCLTGDISPEIMPILWGEGGNGKSTLVETVLHTLGSEYAMMAARELLVVSKGSEGERAKVRLLGKRFVACMETEKRCALSEVQVKELTGGDTVSARFLYCEQFEFRPTHKLCLVTNYKPEIRGTDDGIWRRLPLVEFSQKFLPGDPRRIPDLKERLKQESVGVLSWMAEGCRKWVANGKQLPWPRAIQHASEQYRNSEDSVEQFLQDRCERGEFQARDEKLQTAYREWCAANQRELLSNVMLGQALRSKGIAKRSGEKYYQGCRLKEQ